MGNSKSPLIRIAAAVAVTAILVVIVRDRIEASDLAGWERLAAVRTDGLTTEELEQIWLDVDGGSAEPWAGFYLAMQLYSEGTDLDRARQVADTTVRAFPGHPLAPMLSDLLQALDSYQPGA